MNQEDWRNNVAFLGMDPKKKAILEQLVTGSRGKSAEQCAPLLMAAMTELKKQNLSFSPEESAVMISLLSANLTPAEQKKFEHVQKLFSKRSGCNPLYRISFIILSTPPRYLPAHIWHQVRRYLEKAGLVKKMIKSK